MCCFRCSALINAHFLKWEDIQWFFFSRDVIHFIKHWLALPSVFRLVCLMVGDVSKTKMKNNNWEELWVQIVPCRDCNCCHTNYWTHTGFVSSNTQQACKDTSWKQAWNQWRTIKFSQWSPSLSCEPQLEPLVKIPVCPVSLCLLSRYNDRVALGLFFIYLFVYFGDQATALNLLGFERNESHWLVYWFTYEV